MTAIKEAVLAFDRSVFFFFQEMHAPHLFYVLAWPTYLGGTVICLTFVVAGVLVLDRIGGHRKLPALVVGILSASWLTVWLKLVFHRPRPHVYWASDDVKVIFSKPLNYAFPSGHTAVVFAAATVLYCMYPKKLFWVWFAAVWIAVTRIYTGAHYPSDLLGGAIVGVVCGLLSCRLLGKPAESQKLS